MGKSMSEKDMVEITRCKDCWMGKGINHKTAVYCIRWNTFVKKDGFCSEGGTLEQFKEGLKKGRGNI